MVAGQCGVMKALNIDRLARPIDMSRSHKAEPPDIWIMNSALKGFMFTLVA